MSFVQNERQTRAATGYMIPYQRVTQNNISSVDKMIVNARLKVGWSRSEVSISCYVELPPVLIYMGSAMMDHSQAIGWSGILNQMRRWLHSFCSTRTIVIVFGGCRVEQSFLRKLLLKPVLRSNRNVEEFEFILNIISGTDFRQLPQHRGARSK